MVFKFSILGGMTEAQAEHLLDIIKHFVEAFGLTMRGGYYKPHGEEDD